MRTTLGIDDAVLIAQRYLKSKITVGLVVAMIVISIGPVSASDTATENPVAPKAYYGPKGLPGIPSLGIPDRRSGPDVVYYYAAGYQYDTSWGSQAVVTVAKPELGLRTTTLSAR